MIEEVHIRILEGIYRQCDLAIDLFDNLLTSSHSKERRDELEKLYNEFAHCKEVSEAFLVQSQVEPPRDRLLPKWWTLAQLDAAVLTPLQYEELAQEILEGANHDLKEIKVQLEQIDKGSNRFSLLEGTPYMLGEMDLTGWPPQV